MKDDLLKKMEYMLGGDFKDWKDSPTTSEKTVEKVSEPVLENVSDDYIESVGKLMENFYETFFYRDLNESEQDNIQSLNIYDELYVIQEALDSIKEKVQMNEDIAALGAAVPGLAALTLGILGAYAKSGGELKLPTKVANVFHDIGQYVTNGKEKERRAAIEATIKRGNPNIDPKDLKYFVDDAIKRAKEDNERSGKPKRVLHAGQKTYDTDFAKINQSRFNLPSVASK